MNGMVACPGCGAILPGHDGPTHRYMESSPGCWAAYGEVLAREFSDPRYMAVHRLTVDTYAVQHPGRPSPQTIQSVAIHLVGLYASLQLHLHPKVVAAGIKRAADKGRFQWLERPTRLGDLTVADVLPARSPDEHARLVHRWAEAAWTAWAGYHSQVKEWSRIAALE